MPTYEPVRTFPSALLSRQQLCRPVLRGPPLPASGPPGPRACIISVLVRIRRPEVPHVRTSVVCDRHHSHHRQFQCKQAAASALRAGSLWSVLLVLHCAALRSRQRVLSRRSAVFYSGVRYSSLRSGETPIGIVMSGLDAPGCSLFSLRLRRLSPDGLPLLAARQSEQAHSALACCVGFRRVCRALRSRHPCRLQSASSPLRQRASFRRPDSHAAIVVTVHLLFAGQCQRRSHRHHSARTLSVRRLPRPTDLPAHYFRQPEVVANATTSARQK